MGKSRISKITYSQDLPGESAIWIQKLVTKLLINELDIDLSVKAKLLASADRRFRYKGGSQ
ncbi:hypothetical protein MUN89_19735 [Halobacillus salinarum]|uniref:Uncharacterized protein n=1 Tax=Halobacillus salinarum TaxID=2932257 RepID=A0ABY4EJ21_9BACI|nr:hypothetical protein [Halobacillus salinarum]UOQ44068.1 hypothetical protein MUN89_19735 [Halobacillus salinarum]